VPQIRQLSVVLPNRITFILPARNRSGGVRVTMEMANRLIEAGYSIRIAHMVPRGSRWIRIRDRIKKALQRLRGATADDWLTEYHGPIESFSDLSDLDFQDGEIAIAVGSVMVPELHKLHAPICKIRFNHGLHGFLTERMEAAWGPKMNTLTVASTLIPRLKQYNHESKVWCVPNGIDREVYFDEGYIRDGIGTMYSGNLAKAPDDILAILERVEQQFPSVPRRAFGTQLQPNKLRVNEYWQLPTVEKVRELYGRSKIWLVMSKEEGLPGSVLEAMACGCVVVSSANTGSVELIRHGENGLLFPVGDLEACMKLVDSVLADEVMYKSLRAGGVETAQHYSWERAVKCMEVALREIVGGFPAQEPVIPFQTNERLQQN